MRQTGSDAPAFIPACASVSGTRVSSRWSAGTQPCRAASASASTIPVPAGSRWTTHQPRARETMMNVSPLHTPHDSQPCAQKEWANRMYTTTSDSSSCSAMYEFIVIE
jgi:hypothetical protein